LRRESAKVAGASHLFEEGNTLTIAAAAARHRFLRHLVAGEART